jgi:hypothetical protein
MLVSFLNNRPQDSKVHCTEELRSCWFLICLLIVLLWIDLKQYGHGSWVSGRPRRETESVHYQRLFAKHVMLQSEVVAKRRFVLILAVAVLAHHIGGGILVLVTYVPRY